MVVGVEVVVVRAWWTLGMSPKVLKDTHAKTSKLFLHILSFQNIIYFFFHRQSGPVLTKSLSTWIPKGGAAKVGVKVATFHTGLGKTHINFFFFF